EWTELSIAAGPAPAARFGAGAGFESASRRLVIFGGRTASPASGAGLVFGDAWLLPDADGGGGGPARVRLRPEGGAPARRLRAATAYPPSQNGLVVAFGENEHLASTRLRDVWVLTDAIGNLPLVSADQSAASFAPGTLSPDGVYFWRTVARDSHGATNGDRFF